MIRLLFADGEPVLWAGTEISFDETRAQQELALKHIGTPAFEKWVSSGMQVRGSGAYDGANGLPAMIEKRGSIGILKIEGRLVNGAAGWYRFYGMVGYDDIAGAAAQLYGDPDVKKVLVRIESPGGMVDGIIDCGTQLEQITATKPSLVYSGQLCCSGGYWLATSIKGAELYAGPTAEIGSIGVLSIHTDITKALELAGVKKTVLRAGENKARLNPYEPLTDELKAKELVKMADVHKMFRAQVGRGRPNLNASELLAVTDGSTFMGKQALSAGLVDKVASFEQALKLLDSEKYSGNTPSHSKGAQMKLSHETIAKLMAGVPIDQLGLTAEEQTEAQQLLDSVRNVNKDSGNDSPKPGLNAGNGGGAQAPPAGDDTKLSAQVELLTSQLATANDKVVSLTADLKIAKDASAPLQAENAALLKIACASLGRMQVALGAADTTEGMDAKSVIEQHEKVVATFNEKFKQGRQTQDPQVEKKEVSVAPELRQFTQLAAMAQQQRSRK